MTSTTCTTCIPKMDSRFRHFLEIPSASLGSQTMHVMLSFTAKTLVQGDNKLSAACIYISAWESDHSLTR